jgi:predicted metalloprotease with PDZ domain
MTRLSWIVIVALVASGALPAIAVETPLPVRYALTAAPVNTAGVSPAVHVAIALPSDATRERADLIMPRAIPMGYSQVPYDAFVSGVVARTRSGAAVNVARGDGPRWSIGAMPAATTGPAADPIASIEYDVDLLGMEAAILSGGDSSHSRDGYLAMLGYSVFAYVEGFEDRPIELSASAPSNRASWPVFSTLAPKVPASIAGITASAPDFYGLADSQILMGPGFRLTKLKGAPELFMAVHAEGEVDTAAVTPLAEQAYAALIAYFGSAPFPHYTLVFDYLKPLSSRHTYGFSMEHMQSATFGALASAAPTARATDRERAAWRYNVAHHIAHAWIPKRCAGEGYFPFRWELAPLIDTIWLSEGFGQYAAADALSDVLPLSADGRPYVETLVATRFRNPLREMPDFVTRMPLVDLSRIASLLYSEDFRTGRTVFARGGLMAEEMDRRIREQSGGAKRLRDALRGLVAWSARERRAFRIDELPTRFEESTGVDTRDVMERWLRGMDRNRQ